jgi:O-antigen ligase
MTENLLGTLAEHGLLGLMLVIALIGIFFLYKEAKMERNDRLTDMKDVWQKDVEYRAELKNLIQSILDLLRVKSK